MDTAEQAAAAKTLAESLSSIGVSSGGDPKRYPPLGDILNLARDYLRLRELAEVKYELLLSDRIDKLYMALNVRARGEEAEPWNRLVDALASALVRWIANERWAVAEHRDADKLREGMRQIELSAGNAICDLDNGGLQVPSNIDCARHHLSEIVRLAGSGDDG